MEHLRSLCGGMGFAENLAVNGDDGIGGDDNRVRGDAGGHLPGLLLGQGLYQPPGGEGGVCLLLLPGGDYVKMRDSHPRQQLPAAGGLGCKNNIGHGGPPKNLRQGSMQGDYFLGLGLSVKPSR